MLSTGQMAFWQSSVLGLVGFAVGSAVNCPSLLQGKVSALLTVLGNGVQPTFLKLHSPCQLAQLLLGEGIDLGHPGQRVVCLYSSLSHGQADRCVSHSPPTCFVLPEAPSWQSCGRAATALRDGGSTSSGRAGRTSALRAPGCSPAPSICSSMAMCSLCRGLRPGCSIPSAGQEPLPGAHRHRAESCLHPAGGASSW